MKILIHIASLFSRRPGKHRWHPAGRETGGSVLELALLAPILMLILFAMVDVTRWVFLGIEINSAARAGAQYGSLSLSNAYNFAGIQAAAQNDVPDLTGVTVTSSSQTPSTMTCWCPSAPGTAVTCKSYPANPCTSGSQIVLLQVNTSMTYSPWIPYPPFTSSVTIKGQAIIPVGQY